MSFDRLARGYRALEWVVAGRLLQKCRTAFIGDVGHPRRALILGEGPGRFLIELLRRHPEVEVTCVERSEAMIHQAKRHLRRHGLDASRTRFEALDALVWKAPDHDFDLVVTHFFLDCFRADELQRVVATAAKGATQDAQWLLADFCVPESGWRRWRARWALALMYAFFRATTELSASELTRPDPYLERWGFRLEERRHASFGLLHSDLWRR